MVGGLLWEKMLLMCFSSWVVILFDVVIFLCMLVCVLLICSFISVVMNRFVSVVMIRLSCRCSEMLCLWGRGSGGERGLIMCLLLDDECFGRVLVVWWFVFLRKL